MRSVTFFSKLQKEKYGRLNYESPFDILYCQIAKKIMKLFAIVLVVAYASIAYAIDIDFDNKPEFGLPDDARDQECEESGQIGSLDEMIQKDLISHIKIRYFNDELMTRSQVERFVSRLFESNRTQVFCYPAWANHLMEPNIEGVVYYKNMKKGQLLIWDFQACLRNSNGKWLFIMFPKVIKDDLGRQGFLLMESPL